MKKIVIAFFMVFVFVSVCYSGAKEDWKKDIEDAQAGLKRAGTVYDHIHRIIAEMGGVEDKDLETTDVPSKQKIILDRARAIIQKAYNDLEKDTDISNLFELEWPKSIMPLRRKFRK